MKLILLEEYSHLSDELNEFVAICNRYNYRPNREEFQEIIEFLLLFQNGTSTLCESSLVDFLYEEKFSIISEETTYDPTKDWESATGLAGQAVRTVGKGALGILGAGALAAVGVGAYISYLFKKGKVKKAAQNEFKPQEELISSTKKINDLKLKLADLEGSEAPKLSLPGYLDGDDGNPSKTKKTDSGNSSDPKGSAKPTKSKEGTGTSSQSTEEKPTTNNTKPEEVKPANNTNPEGVKPANNTNPEGVKPAETSKVSVPEDPKETKKKEIQLQIDNLSQKLSDAKSNLEKEKEKGSDTKSIEDNIGSIERAIEKLQNEKKDLG
jgi:hypothetical protein